jgi:hypothetical protein
VDSSTVGFTCSPPVAVKQGSQPQRGSPAMAQEALPGGCGAVVLGLPSADCSRPAASGRLLAAEPSMAAARCAGEKGRRAEQSSLVWLGKQTAKGVGWGRLK